MFKNNGREFGTTKQSTDNLIDEAIQRQNDWLKNRRIFARNFLRRMNVFARPARRITKVMADNASVPRARRQRVGVFSYWFPILCAFVVVLVAFWIIFIHVNKIPGIFDIKHDQEQITAKTSVEESKVPTFDIVRIEKGGAIVIAGRWLPEKNVSVFLNGKPVATQQANASGEFVYSPAQPLKSGNYTISLVGAEPETKSAENVFVYISPEGYKNSVSLLMTKDGSTLLQAPTLLKEGDLSVSKIDYLDTGRIIVIGEALPRLRVSLALDDKYLNFAHVSDYGNFGVGADVGKLESGKEYTLTLRLHDGDGRTISKIKHTFVMPEMTGDDDTYYTVRRGDCLWIIARNFLRHGVLFSIIAERNNIENPDLIFPKQLLQIPTKK